MPPEYRIYPKDMTKPIHFFVRRGEWCIMIKGGTSADQIKAARVHRDKLNKELQS